MKLGYFVASIFSIFLLSACAIEKQDPYSKVGNWVCEGGDLLITKDTDTRYSINVIERTGKSDMISGEKQEDGSLKVIVSSMETIFLKYSEEDNKISIIFPPNMGKVQDCFFNSNPQ